MKTRPAPLLSLATTLVICGGVVVSGPSAGQGQAPAHAEATTVQTTPAGRAAAPMSRAEGNEALNNAVASVVVAALSEQFDGRTVSVKLDRTEVAMSSLRDRVVTGEGRMRIGSEDEEWIGFHYRTLYDTQLANAAYPQITLGGQGDDGRVLPNDARLVSQLDERVVRQLDREFAGQPVRLQLDQIQTIEAGARYLRIDAVGLADFGREGTTSAQVDALYDRVDGTWVRVNYELGPAAVIDPVAVDPTERVAGP